MAWVQMCKQGVVIDRSEFIAELKIDVAVRKGSASDSGCRFWYRQNRLRLKSHLGVPRLRMLISLYEMSYFE
jgi:hypothetical protein